MKQAVTLRGKILESLPLTIVMVNGFVWKSGISMRALVHQTTPDEDTIVSKRWVVNVIFVR